jgi:sugar phosphate isomerase/epimerase
MDIPGPNEMELLLNLAEPDQLGFVYDVGHAQVMDRLGFYPNEEWLRRFGSRIIGIHLHDVIGIDDHYAPGFGEVDFDQIAPHLPANAFRTYELRGNVTPEQVKAGVEYLGKKGYIQCL